DSPVNEDTEGTRLVSAEVDNKSIRNSAGSLGRTIPEARTTEGLTRVGSVLGTPLYMSPEQCRGEKLDARSDIYSLGVIAYQMLLGNTPFAGEFTEVMEAHKHVPPPPLVAKQVGRRVGRVIMSALEKDPDKRPQSAEAFASELRSKSEGIWLLLRRALVIFSEQMPKFLGLTTLLSIPVIMLTATLVVIAFLRISEAVPEWNLRVLTGAAGFLWGAVIAFCAYLITGTTTWIVTQHLAAPLRPISVRDALVETRKKWKTFAGTGIVTTLLTFVFGIVSCGIGFLITAVLWTLVAPVVMMENLKGWKAIKRSQQLVRRSLGTTIAAVLIMFLIPAVISGCISFVVNVSAKAFTQTSGFVQVTEDAAGASNQKSIKPEENGISFSIGDGQRVKIMDQKQPMGDMKTRVVATVSESLIQILWLPMHIFVTAFTAIIVALLFLKTRQSGGEPMHELLAGFEESDKPRKKWQERMRQRLIQSGRITSRS
ncbi:MAG TPA: hypothetical protein VHL50_03665, partial [Pyrinomonadaceae bacterium]|nr:hypothetical protein [Pyrinomonadaceae bacterium]